MKKKQKKRNFFSCNFLRKNCRGQFYLVAGLVIISIIVGFVVVVNYSQKGNYLVVDDLNDELKIESQKVLDYDISHQGETIRDFGEDYSSYVGNDIEIYFITGTSSQIDAYKYLDGVETQLDDPEIEGDKIIFTLEEVDYEFDLKSENFYYLIYQKIKGESYVVTG